MSPADRKIRTWIVDLLPYLVVVNLVLFVLCAAVATVAAVTAIRTEHNTQRIAVLERDDRAAAMGSCVRLKIQRTQVNRIALLAFSAFSDAAAREKRLGEQPGPQQATHRRSARLTLQAATRLRWTPQTDCHRAVVDPLHYRPPHPVPFRKGQRSVP